MARQVEITVDTTFGTLVARAGDDLSNEPDINIFLRDKNGREAEKYPLRVSNSEGGRFAGRRRSR